MCKKLLLLAVAFAAIATSHGQPDCNEKCGDLTIPYPFGTQPGCYINENFLITCNDSVAFHANTSIKVLNVSVDGELLVPSPIAYDCYDKYGEQTVTNLSVFTDSRFPISYTKNKFTAVGCDTYAYVVGVRGRRYATGCISYCDKKQDVVNGTCSGIGCCQTSIPSGVWDFEAKAESYYNHVYVSKYNPCSYVFLTEEKSFNFSTLYLPNLKNVSHFPMVLDWAVGNDTCDIARKNPETNACKDNSTCLDSNNGPGYRCYCPDGYSGNPYLANGCQDVNECETPSLNECSQQCTNTIGNYTCSCFHGYHGDGRKDGSGCTQNAKSHVASIVGVSISFATLFLAISLIVLGRQKRRMMLARKEYFKQNGGYLLQQLLFKRKNSIQAAKIFAEEELKKATNNFSKDLVIGQGGYGVVYKGLLSDDHVVAIKKSKAIDRTQIEQFVNEVIVLSQISHLNAVKLLGCCLETPVPLLVYEFITNGTLFQWLHGAAFKHSLSWDVRLRIAEETAGALAHMHSVQIIHRDVKSANILLDDNYTAKVSDFGVSRSVSFDQDQITTLVQGTLGYMDPEYFQSGILTEKSDVYSFGVVLVELLTGKKAICSDCEQKSLVLYFISAIQADMLFEIVEDMVKKEGDSEQLQGIAELARICLRLEGAKRPTMKQVVEELKKLRQLGRQPQMKLQQGLNGINSFDKWSY